jgi:hypothetical protein
MLASSLKIPFKLAMGKRLQVWGLFYGIWHRPKCQLLKGQVELDESGYVWVKAGSTQISREGVYAAGDRQVTNAAVFITWDVCIGWCRICMPQVLLLLSSCLTAFPSICTTRKKVFYRVLDVVCNSRCKVWSRQWVFVHSSKCLVSIVTTENGHKLNRFHKIESWMSHNPCLQYLFAIVRARDLSYFLRSPKHSLQLPTQTLLFSKKSGFWSTSWLWCCGSH